MSQTGCGMTLGGLHISEARMDFVCMQVRQRQKIKDSTRIIGFSGRAFVWGAKSFITNSINICRQPPKFVSLCKASYLLNHYLIFCGHTLVALLHRCR